MYSHIITLNVTFSKTGNTNMSPVIRVTDKLYERLGKHASGFEAPSKVIERLLEAYESTSSGDTSASSRTSSAPQDATSLLELGFKSFFKVEPRPFGQKNFSKKGFSDNCNGVQWNTSIDRDTGVATLGVNLEGMKYQDWPIARFLIREKSESKIPGLSTQAGADEVYVGLYRDAWQAAARLIIEERFIIGNDILLSDLNSELWSDMIDEALLCLNSENDFRGRKTQSVTIKKTGKVVEKEVSPHLNVYTNLWDSPPDDIEDITNIFEAAYNRLLPVYELVKTQTLS